MLKGKRIAFLGAGSMGQALIKGLLEAKLVDKEQILASAKSQGKLDLLHEKFGIDTTLDNERVAEEGDIVFLAVKPQVVAEILLQTKKNLTENKLLISIAAGISLDSLESQLNHSVPVIRVMPNTPCLVGEGASGISLGTYANEEHKELAEFIFSSVGKAIVVPEKLLNAVTGLSGSGPAYIYMAIEALADGGVREGLTRQQALILAAQTVLGAARMVLETGEHPGVLKDKVTSPGGTTIEAVASLEEDGLRKALIKAVSVAAKKAEDLGK